MGEVDETLIDERAGKRLILDYSLDRPRLGVRIGAGELAIIYDGAVDGEEQGAAVRRTATKLSPDGRYVTLGLVENGEGRPRIRILDLNNLRFLPETLSQPLWADADGFYVEWLADSSGFLWARNPLRSVATPDAEREHSGHIYLHRLNSPPADDTALFGPSLVAGLRADDTPYPGLSGDGRWVIVRVRHARGRSLWAAPLSGVRLTAPFRKVIASSGSIAGWGARGDRLWAIVPDNAATHALVSLSLIAKIASPVQVAIGETGVLSGLAVASDALYLAQRDGALSSMWRVGSDGIRQQIVLPRAGVVDQVESGIDNRGVRLRLRSGLYPDERLEVLPGAATTRPVLAAPKGLPPAWDNYTVTVVQAPARDGMLVPVSIMHNRTQFRDGRGFVRMDVYGCFGTSMEFIYDPSNLAWLERGGMLAIGHVRGGSELGRGWHEANIQRGHATAADDTVDIVEHLVRERWIAPGRAALVGGSCGAATAGNAALARPDLIAAASLHVGGVDEWRAWSETASGARSVLDIGDPTTALGIRRLVAASPYHRLLPGVRRPGLFVFNGGTDYTIPLWMGAKFVARARDRANFSSGPLLFRVDRKAGHSGPTSFDGRLRAYTDDLAFQFWQLGHTDFQPPKAVPK